MPTETYELIAQTTLATATSTVTFGSLPQTYRDLVIVASIKYTTSNGGYIGGLFNSDSGNNYSSVYMLGWSSSPNAFSGFSSNESFGRFGNAGTANFETTIFTVMDYSATDKHKTFLSRTNIVSLYTVAYAGRWASTSAINSMSLFPDSGNFAAESTFALYGIAS